VALGNVPLKSTFDMPDGQHSSNTAAVHEVFRVTSAKTGQQWAIDINGGQYGICQPLWKWQTYENTFVKRVAAVYRPATFKTLLAHLATIEGNPSLTYGVVGDAAMELDIAVDIWEQEHLQLSKLVALGQAEFQAQKTSLHQAMDDAVRKFVKAGAYLSKVRAAKTYEAAHPCVSQMRCTAASKWLDTVSLLRAEEDGVAFRTREDSGQDLATPFNLF
jgi:hypothetical protein